MKTVYLLLILAACIHAKPVEEWDSGDESGPSMVDQSALTQAETQLDVLQDGIQIDDFQTKARGHSRYERKIAFSTYLSKTYTSPGAGQHVKFDGIILNHGNGYTASTGIFRVPVNGVYFFSYSIKTGTYKNAKVKLVQNGVIINGLIATAYYTENQASNSAIVQLTEGTHVWVEVNLATQIDGDSDIRFTTFSGFLLYEN